MAMLYVGAILPTKDLLAPNTDYEDAWFRGLPLRMFPQLNCLNMK